MPIFYTEVDPNGYISRSMFITNPSDYTPREGYRLLPDNPPNPPQYIVGQSYPVRIEPVPLDATKIPYEIVAEEKTVYSSNVNSNDLIDILNELNKP